MGKITDTQYKIPKLHNSTKPSLIGSHCLRYKVQDYGGFRCCLQDIYSPGKEVDSMLVCDECGLVIEAQKVDLGPEWRAYSAEEHEEKARTGAPTTRRRHDKGLTTEIDWRDRDAYGKTQ